MGRYGWGAKKFMLKKFMCFFRPLIKFPPVILGPEMAEPILWAPGIFWLFLLENPHAHKIPPFRGGVLGFFRRGGGSANFIFMGMGIFPIELEISAAKSFSMRRTYKRLNVSKERLRRLAFLPSPIAIKAQAVAVGCLSVFEYSLGPAKTHILRGTPQTCAIKTRAVTDN